MTKVSWIIFLICAFSCQCTNAAWLNFPSCRSESLNDKIWEHLDTIWEHLTSFFTWFDSGGYDLFGLCPEEEEPDWDLFEPEGKRCRKLSDLLSADPASWRRLEAGARSLLSDPTVLTSVVNYVLDLTIWKTISTILYTIIKAVQPYFNQLADAFRNVFFNLSSFELFEHVPDYMSKANIKTCLEFYMSNFVLYNNTSLPLIVTAACLTAIFVVCNILADDDISDIPKRVTFSNVDVLSDNDSRRAQRLAGISQSRPSKKGKQRKKKRPRQRPTSRDSSTDPDTCPHNGMLLSPHDHPAACCLLSLRNGSNRPESSRIDDEALRYIVGSATDIAPGEIKERIRKALQVLVNHEEEECCRPDQGSASARNNGSKDWPGSVVYDIRYKDNLPADVMDVLFCIDPNCQHDHGRYELRGCEIVVKPADYRTMNNREKSNVTSQNGTTNATGKVTESRRSKGEAYSTIEVSPTEVHVWGQDEDFVNKYHESLSGQDLLHGAVTGSDSSKNERKEEETKDSLSKQIRGPDALDQEVERTDSFPDWRAPDFDQDCPYCRMSAQNADRPQSGQYFSKKNDYHDASSSEQSLDTSGEQDTTDKSGRSGSGSTSRDTSLGEGCSGLSGPRTEGELMELIQEADLDEVIGPPLANSSFQKEEENRNQRKSEVPKFKPGTGQNLEDNSQNTSRRGTNKNRVKPHQTRDTATSTRYGCCAKPGIGKESVRVIQQPIRDSPRNGDAFQKYTNRGLNMACKLNPRFVKTIEPLTALGGKVRVGDDAESRDTEYAVRSVADNSVLIFDEDEFSLSTELQDSSLNDSNLSLDLSELNRSLSFYGDVSIVELVASWLVQNVVERAAKHTSVLTPFRLKESLLDISTHITEAMDLIE